VRFSVVTPVLDGERFIDQTVMSVVSQAGPFVIRYHVQDGGSKDSTLDRLSKWHDLLTRGEVPILCEGIDFTYSSLPDSGIYGAINVGFVTCGTADVMCWINSDDRFEAGAFSSVTTILKAFASIRWLCGRATVIDQDGGMAVPQAIRGFPRNAIAAGIFDQRYASCFINQEGCFWRTSLWQETGGIRANLRLAGDFDLWRRFARVSDLVMADAIFACFRIRPGQLSRQLASYYAEIDKEMSDAEASERLSMSTLFRSCKTPTELRAAGFAWRVVENHPGHGGWLCTEQP
jgi:glycosyltransferase involved in cell wall biosynthesis